MEIHANKRNLKDNTKTLRKGGVLPATVFSKKISVEKAESLPISVKSIDFDHVYAEAGESSLVRLAIGDEKPRDVLIKHVQFDPIHLKPIHVAFYEVDMSQEIEAEVPVEIIGEAECKPVLSKEGIVIKVLDNIKVRCLPGDIPHQFDVDVSKLEKVGDFLTIEAAVSVDSSKIEILDAKDEVIVKIDFAQQIEQVVAEEKSASDVEVTTAKPEKDEESEKPEDKEKKEKEKDMKEAGSN